MDQRRWIGGAPAALADATAAPLRVRTLGGFRVWRDGAEVESGEWGRDKAVQLFQFLITMRRQRLDREQIVDALWPELSAEAGERDFKVALNAVHNAIEPERAPRAEPRYIRRFGQAYGLVLDEVWVDAEALEAHVAAANQAASDAREAAIEHYAAAAELYGGDYLPERRYEDWSSLERERLQVLALGAMTTLAEMWVEQRPLEAIRLSQRALGFDPAWEAAWRIQMRAHMAQGNRVLAVRAWRRCRAMLADEFDLEPLPETRAVFEEIVAVDPEPRRARADAVPAEDTRGGGASRADGGDRATGAEEETSS